jgi:hypothetical protein
MKFRMIAGLALLGGLSAFSAAHAEDEEVPEDAQKGCAAVAESLAFLGGTAVGAPFGTVAAGLGAHIATRFGSDALGKKCQNYYKSLEKQKEFFDYPEFVEIVCNGNPMTCPNGYNIPGDLPHDPRRCDTYVVCNISLAVRPDASLTVQDILNAGTFFDLSYGVGYWDYVNYGHLVGVTGIDSSPGPSLEIY